MLDQRSIADVPPHKRNIGMVFQSYSLFPHLTVTENVGFPAAHAHAAFARRSPPGGRTRCSPGRAGHLGARYPAAVFRRAATAGRAWRGRWSPHPRLLLMDEPLGALDKKLREQMQVEIKRIHRERRHHGDLRDPRPDRGADDVRPRGGDASGPLAQVGTPRALYEAPASLFVADFLGDSNLLGAKVIRASGDEFTVEIESGETIRAKRATFAAPQGSRVVVLLRPEDMSVGTTSERTDGQDVLAGLVKDISYHGDTFKLDVAVGEEELKVKVGREQGTGIRRGQQVFLTWKSAAARVLPVDRADAAVDGDER